MNERLKIHEKVVTHFVELIGLKGGCTQNGFSSENLMFSSYIWMFVIKIQKNVLYSSRSISGKKKRIRGTVTPHPGNSNSASEEQ